MTWPNFYLVCFLVGFALSILSLLGGFGRLHLHLPKHFQWPAHGSLPHAGTHPGSLASGPTARVGGIGGRGAPPAAQTSIFNFFSAMAFLAWFGGAGYILTTHSSLWTLVILAIATAAGTAGGSIVFWFFAKVLVSHERVLDPADYSLIGVLGRISVPIREGGTGEIIFSQAGGRRTCGARSEDRKAVPHGAEVVITAYERGIAYVRPWEELVDVPADERTRSNA
jgi:membrane protein implicated in regulation of membrane protease activity